MPSRPLPARRARAGSVLAVLLVLGSAACGGDDAGSTSTTSTSTTAATTASSAQSSETTGSTAPPTPSTPTAYTATARDAVNELKAAWDVGDQARARAIAPGEVVDALFPLAPDGFEVYGCDTGEFDTSTCSYRNRSSGVYITVSSTRFPEGWQVSTLFVDGG